MAECEHQDFEAHVAVHRLGDGEGAIIGFSADIRISCAECGDKFRFIGVPLGLLPNQPSMDVTETEIHLPIRPATGDPDFGLGVPGFKINAGRS